MVKRKDFFKSLLSWKLGNGEKIDFWNDRWLGIKRLQDYTNRAIDSHVPVANYITNGNWDLGKLLEVLPKDIVNEIQGFPIPVDNSEDNLIWPYTSNGKFTLILLII